MKIINWIYRTFKKKSTHKYNDTFDKKRLVLNLKKDPDDTRDYPLLFKAIPRAEIPKQIDLREYFTVIKNQGSIGSCAGFASCASAEYLRNKDTIKSKSKESLFDLSELFVYYNARKLQGWENQDSGSYLRDICKTLMDDGIALEEVYPYDPAKVFEKPSWMAYFCARALRIKSYYRVMDINGMKQALSRGMPIIIGITVYNNFFNYKEGIYKTNTGQQSGGHAITVVGYDDDKGAFLIRNSWGIGWGESGYVWYDYNTLMSNLMDAWVISYD